MNLASVLRRTFIGRATPATEDVQQRILTYLSDRGFATTSEIGETQLSDIPPGARQREVMQAAQILVNRKMLEARAIEGPEAGKRVDPVHADGPLRLILLPE